MAANEESAPSKELVNVVVRSSERLEGAASLLKTLEDKAEGEQITPAELAAIRCIVETCASGLGTGLDINRASPSRTGSCKASKALTCRSMLAESSYSVNPSFSLGSPNSLHSLASIVRLTCSSSCSLLGRFSV